MATNTQTKPLFPLGHIVATPGAIQAFIESDGGPITMKYLILRHAIGDWGDVDAGDGAANDLSVTDGTRILSAYELDGGGRVWIITEADRSSTTVLLPEEY